MATSGLNKYQLAMKKKMFKGFLAQTPCVAAMFIEYVVI
jgi:hypothetical protein